MVSLDQAASVLIELSKEVTKEPSAQSNRRAADMLGKVGRAIEDLDYRMEALELVISTLAKKEGLTASQVRREGVAPLHSNPKAAAFRHDAISTHLERILALADI